MTDFESLKPKLNKIQRRSGMLGGAILALCVVGLFHEHTQFYQSYLFGYVFWLGLTLGSLVLLSLHHLVGGGWGFVIQRFLESGTSTLPLMAILFLPLFFGMQDLYDWARPESVAADSLLQHKAKYLNVGFFWVRAAVYFLIWGALITFLNKWSKKQDETADASLSDKLRKLGGPAMLLYFLTVTFSSIDWVMSLAPQWFSTIFGVIFVIGQGLLTLAFAIIALNMFSGYKPLSDILGKQHFHDLGNLMLAFVMLWAYISLSQFLIIWSGNLPEEIPWYLDRLQGGWQWLALFVVIFHFALPFILLLSRRTKRNQRVLAKVAFVMVFMRLIDLFWIVAPNFHPGKISVHWLDLAVPAGIGGVWVAFFIRNLKGCAVLPLHDPRLKEALQYE
ncbi:MAG: hypothetical protein ACE5IR_07175 [bacterium]